MGGGRDTTGSARVGGGRGEPMRDEASSAAQRGKKDLAGRGQRAVWSAMGLRYATTLIARHAAHVARGAARGAHVIACSRTRRARPCTSCGCISPTPRACCGVALPGGGEPPPCTASRLLASTRRAHRYALARACRSRMACVAERVRDWRGASARRSAPRETKPPLRRLGSVSGVSSKPFARAPLTVSCTAAGGS